MEWSDFFNKISRDDYMVKLNRFLDEEYNNYVIYPKRINLFKAFELTPLKEVKVVIMGQDPYHEPEQAMGLAFSVPEQCKLPPSLVNIYSEIQNEYNEPFMNIGGDLTYLCKQGVLLINTIFTVREHQPLSHNIPEYKKLSTEIIKMLNSLNQPIVFLLWGKNAQQYSKFLNNDKHLVLCATHPSPLGANKGGWFGCNHFKITNEFLIKNGVKPINWLKN